jgi:hypothetical protein
VESAIAPVLHVNLVFSLSVVSSALSVAVEVVAVNDFLHLKEVAAISVALIEVDQGLGWPVNLEEVSVWVKHVAELSTAKTAVYFLCVEQVDHDSEVPVDAHTPVGIVNVGSGWISGSIESSSIWRSGVSSAVSVTVHVEA